MKISYYQNGVLHELDLPSVHSIDIQVPESDGPFAVTVRKDGIVVKGIKDSVIDRIYEGIV